MLQTQKANWPCWCHEFKDESFEGKKHNEHKQIEKSGGGGAGMFTEANKKNKCVESSNISKILINVTGFISFW